MRFLKLIFVLIIFQFLTIEIYAQLLNEGFEGPFPPVGWLVYQNDCGTQVYWWQDDDPNDVCNGNNSAIILGNNVLCGTAKDWLVTPQLAPSNQNYILSFTMHQSYIQEHGSIYTLRVSTASATDTNDFQIVQTWNESQMPINCTVTNFDLTNYIGDSIYVAFVMENDEGDNWIIDDVNGIPMVGNCYPPTGLETFDVISTSAGLKWASIDSISNYFWEVVPKGNSAGSGVITSGYIADTSDIANGLQMTTDYDFRVRSLCPSGDTSYYSFPYSFTTLGPPPLNDECLGAIALSVNPDNTCANLYSGTNLDATESLPGCIGMANDDVWYKFTAVSSKQDIQLQNISAVKGNSIDMVFEVFSGTCSNLTSLLCSDDNFNTIEGLIQGDIYYLRVYSKYNTSNQEFDICIKTPPVAPVNDNCVNAVALTVNTDNNCNNITSGTTLGATESMSGCIGDADDDVWYSFMATEIKHSIDITNVIPVEGNNADMVHEIFKGTCGNLISIKCSDQNYSSVTGLTIGQIYYIRVYSKYNTSRQNFDICVKTPPQPPLNDFCENSIQINIGEYGTCPGNSVSCSTVNATNTIYGSCDNYGSDPDLWYKFKVPINGDYSFSSISGDPGITLFKGNCDNLIEVGCLNNTDGTLENLDTSVFYYARVFTDFEEANTEFCIEKDITPENDDIQAAILLNYGQGYCDMPKVGTNHYATDSPTNPTPSCGNYNGGDVWYKVIVPLSGNLEIEMSRVNNLQDGAMAVYSGNFANLTLLSCDDDSNGNPGTNYMPHISLNGQTAGDTLFIRVWEYGNNVFGEFALCAWDPQDIIVSNGGNCIQGQSIVVNNANGNIYTWVPLKDNSGNLISFVYPNGNELGNIIPDVYTTTGTPLRIDIDGRPYINRDIQIQVENQPLGNNPIVRLLYKNEELNDLISESVDVTTIDDMNLTKSEQDCNGEFVPPGTFYLQSSNAIVNSNNDSYLEFQISGFSTFFIHGGDHALPLQVLNIYGQAKKNYNLLNWEINQFSDFDSLILETSATLNKWIPLITFSSKNLRNQYKDFQISSLKYYRLKMILANNIVIYSRVVRIKAYDNFLKSIVYPNPSNGIVNIKTEPNDLLDKLEIYNSKGDRLLKFENINKVQIRFDLKSLKQGVYFMKLFIGKKTIYKKLVLL